MSKQLKHVQEKMGSDGVNNGIDSKQLKSSKAVRTLIRFYWEKLKDPVVVDPCQTEAPGRFEP